MDSVGYITKVSTGGGSDLVPRDFRLLRGTGTQDAGRGPWGVREVLTGISLTYAFT